MLASLSCFIRAFVREAAERQEEHQRESTAGGSSAAPRESLEESLLSCSELLHVSQQLFSLLSSFLLLSLQVERKSFFFLLGSCEKFDGVSGAAHLTVHTCLACLLAAVVSSRYTLAKFCCFHSPSRRSVFPSPYCWENLLFLSRNSLILTVNQAN